MADRSDHTAGEPLTTPSAPRSGAGLPGMPEELRERLRALVREIPDFPREGVLFRDITTLLRDAGAFKAAIDGLVDAYRHAGVEVVAGVESRGFVLGGAVAYLLGAGFVPVRKKGKLPHATISAAYALEYGEAVLEVHADAIRPGQRVLIVDDLLATGGTARATVDLVERLGGEIVGIAFLIELSDLAGSRLSASARTSPSSTSDRRRERLDRAVASRGVAGSAAPWRSGTIEPRSLRDHAAHRAPLRVTAPASAPRPPHWQETHDHQRQQHELRHRRRDSRR